MDLDESKSEWYIGRQIHQEVDKPSCYLLLSRDVCQIREDVVQSRPIADPHKRGIIRLRKPMLTMMQQLNQVVDLEQLSRRPSTHGGLDDVLNNWDTATRSCLVPAIASATKLSHGCVKSVRCRTLY